MAELLEGEGRELHVVIRCDEGGVSAAVNTTPSTCARWRRCLRADLLPQACIPPRELRVYPTWLRQRFVLTQMRTALKIGCTR